MTRGANPDLIASFCNDEKDEAQNETACIGWLVAAPEPRLAVYWPLARDYCPESERRWRRHTTPEAKGAYCVTDSSHISVVAESSLCGGSWLNDQRDFLNPRDEDLCCLSPRRWINEGSQGVLSFELD